MEIIVQKAWEQGPQAWNLGKSARFVTVAFVQLNKYKQIDE